MKYLFILNKFAGVKDVTGELEEKINKLKIEGDIFIEYTQCHGDAKRIVKEYLEKHTDYLRIYVCGGDGTANEALQAMVNKENCSLGVVPVGTGNDFVRSISSDTSLFLDLEKMVRGKERKIDVLECEGVYALNCISAGYDCAVADKAQDFKRWPVMTGPLAYKISIFYCLISKRKHSFVPYADDQMIKLDDGYKTQMLTVIANGKYYGGGIKCAPLAELNDGMMDFMSIPTISIPKFISLLSLFMKGKHVNNKKLPFVKYQKCKKVQLVDDNEIKIGIDGEMFTYKNPTIKIVERAISIIEPDGI